MTVKADAKRRVRLTSVNPGDVFSVHVTGDQVLLTLMKPVETKEPKPAKVRIVKRGRYHVGVLDRPINEEALKKALEEFP